MFSFLPTAVPINWPLGMVRASLKTEQPGGMPGAPVPEEEAGVLTNFSEDRNMLFGGNVVTNDTKVKLMKSPERPDQAPKSASLSMMGPSDRSEALVALGKNPVPELG